MGTNGGWATSKPEASLYVFHEISQVTDFICTYWIVSFWVFYVKVVSELSFGDRKCCFQEISHSEQQNYFT